MTARPSRSSWSTARSADARVLAREASWVESCGAGTARSGRASSRRARASSDQERNWSARVRGALLSAIRTTVLVRRAAVLARRRLLCRVGTSRDQLVEERPDDVDGQREDDRRVLVRPELEQRLQVAKLQGGWALAQRVGRLAQLLGGLELSARIDDLRSALALGLRLACHGPLHRLGNLHVLDLDHPHLDAPGLGLLVDDLAEVLVEVLPVREQRVEVRPPEQRPQG